MRGDPNNLQAGQFLGAVHSRNVLISGIHSQEYGSYVTVFVPMVVTVALPCGHADLPRYHMTSKSNVGESNLTFCGALLPCRGYLVDVPFFGALVSEMGSLVSYNFLNFI